MCPFRMDNIQQNADAVQKGLELICGRAKFQCCVTTVTVVVYRWNYNFWQNKYFPWILSQNGLEIVRWWSSTELDVEMCAYAADLQTAGVSWNIGSQRIAWALFFSNACTLLTKTVSILGHFDLPLLLFFHLLPGERVVVGSHLLKSKRSMSIYDNLLMQ